MKTSGIWSPFISYVKSTDAIQFRPPGSAPYFLLVGAPRSAFANQIFSSSLVIHSIDRQKLVTFCYRDSSELKLLRNTARPIRRQRTRAKTSSHVLDRHMPTDH